MRNRMIHGFHRNQAVQGGHGAAFSMGHVCKFETHFNTCECSGQHEIIEASQMSDSENLTLKFREARPERHVEFFENQFAELVGIVSGRHEYGGNGIRVFIRASADDFETPGAHRSASGFSVAPMPGEYIVQTFLLQHY